MELKDTIEMMNSADYKERFKAEYYQTKIRYEKLKGEIIDRISRFPKDDLDKPLEDLYLLGYDLQRNAFFKKSNTDEQTSMDLGAPENDAD